MTAPQEEPTVSRSGSADAATGGVANSGSISLKVENTFPRWRLPAFAAGAAAVMVGAGLAWGHLQAVSAADSLAPLPSTSATATSTPSGIPSQPAGTTVPPNPGRQQNTTRPTPTRAVTSSRPAAGKSSPATTVVQPSASDDCPPRVVLPAGMGIDLAACAVGSGFTDLMFTDGGIVVGDTIVTKAADQRGSQTVTSYATCRSQLNSTSRPSADNPITKAACLSSGRHVAYVDVLERNSTRMLLTLLIWEEGG